MFTHSITWLQCNIHFMLLDLRKVKIFEFCIFFQIMLVIVNVLFTHKYIIMYTPGLLNRLWVYLNSNTHNNAFEGWTLGLKSFDRSELPMRKRILSSCILLKKYKNNLLCAFSAYIWSSSWWWHSMQFNCNASICYVLYYLKVGSLGYDGVMLLISNWIEKLQNISTCFHFNFLYI